MKNEEKAKEIGNIMLELANYSSYNTPDEQRNNIRNVAERAALKMAQWKDEQAKRQFIDKAWQWIFRVFVITAPLDFQQAIEKEFRKEMKGE